MSLRHTKIAPRPLVGVSCCLREINGGTFHTALDKYAVAVCDHARCDVILIPALGDRTCGGRLDLSAMADRLDGILLTGARSMIAPNASAAGSGATDLLLDPARDNTTIPLIHWAIRLGTPILGICRGFQELCCAFGCSLIQDVAADGRYLDHRAPALVSYADRYLPRHTIKCVETGILARMARSAGLPTAFGVNSLHVQGVASLTRHLAPEAISEDGLIEAASVARSNTFALGVQWHPEWYLDQNAINRALFAHFGAACYTRLRTRYGNDLPWRECPLLAGDPAKTGDLTRREQRHFLRVPMEDE